MPKMNNRNGGDKPPAAHIPDSVRTAWDAEMRQHLANLMLPPSPGAEPLSDAEIVAMVLQDHQERASLDVAPEPPKSPITRPGDLWLLGEHRLMCGSSIIMDDVDTVCTGIKVSLVVTSPPYNQGLDKFSPSGMHSGPSSWTAKTGDTAYSDSLPESHYQQQQSVMLQLWFGVMTDNGSVFYNHKHRYRDKQVVSPLKWMPGPFKWRQEIIWRRPGSVTQNARMFLPSDERIYWLFKGDDFYFDDSTEVKSYSTIWTINPSGGVEHPADYPVELPLRCIKACSRSGDWVADPYCGSGTTLIAAHVLGRRFVGMEIDPKYCDVTLQRWVTLTGENPIRTEDGASWRNLQAAQHATLSR